MVLFFIALLEQPKYVGCEQACPGQNTNTCVEIPLLPSLDAGLDATHIAHQTKNHHGRA